MSLRIGFSGDLSFYGTFAAERAPGRTFDAAVTAFLHGNHHNVLNVEGPVTAHPERRGIGPTLASPPGAALPALRHLQCDVANLANNHTMDCGEAGLDETLALLAGAGIRSLGAGPDLAAAAEPLVLEGEGVRVGMLAVCDPSGTPAGPGVPGVLTHDRERLVRDRLAELRGRCDWVVLCYHGGEEYTFHPMPARRRRLLRYLRAGADVVVAHHAHVVQGWEATPDGVVFYGLGNFVLDHPALLRRPGTYEGLLLRLSFGPREVAWETLFTRSDRAAGRVQAGEPLSRFAPLQPRGRRARWCRDAHRVRTLPRIPGPAPAPGAEAPAAPAGAVAARAARVRGVLRMLRQWNYRPVLLGDLEHRVRRAVGLAAPADEGPAAAAAHPPVFARRGAEKAGREGG